MLVPQLGLNDVVDRQTDTHAALYIRIFFRDILLSIHYLLKPIYVQGGGAGAGAGSGGQEEPGQQHHQCLRQHGGQRGEGQDYSGII